MDVKVHHVCVVCGETSDQVALHYTRLLCNGCRAFFKRTVQGKVKIPECKSDGQCIVNHSSRKACKACRYDACMRAGVDSSKVQQPREGIHDTSMDETQFYIQQQKMMQEGRPDLTSLNWSPHLPTSQQPYIPPPHYLQAPQPPSPQNGIFQMPPIINLHVPSIGIGVFNQNAYPVYHPSRSSFHGTAPYFDSDLSSGYGNNLYTPSADVTDTAFSQWKSWNKGLATQLMDTGSVNHYHNPSIKNDLMTAASCFPKTRSYDPMRSYSHESLGLTTGQYLQYLQHQVPGFSNNDQVPMLAPKLTSMRCDALQSASQPTSEVRSQLTSDVNKTDIKVEIAEPEEVKCQVHADSAKSDVGSELGATKPITSVITSFSGFQDSSGKSVTPLSVGADDNDNQNCPSQMFANTEHLTQEKRDVRKLENSKKSNAFMMDMLLKDNPRLRGGTFQEFCPFNSFVPTTNPSVFIPGFTSSYHSSHENLNTAPVQWLPIPVYPPTYLSDNVKAAANTSNQKSHEFETNSRVGSTQSASRDTHSDSGEDSYPSSPESGNGFFHSEVHLNRISPFATKSGSEILASDEESQDDFVDCETVDDDDKQMDIDTDDKQVDVDTNDNQENADKDLLKGGTEDKGMEDPSGTNTCELSATGVAIADSGLGNSGTNSTATDLSTLQDNKENLSFKLKRKGDNSCGDFRPQAAKRLRYKRWPLLQRRGPGYTSTPITKIALGLKVNKRKCTCTCVCQDETADST